MPDAADDTVLRAAQGEAAAAPGTDGTSGSEPRNGEDRPARGERGEVTASIQSVERAAHILGFFTPRHPRLTLSELTARLGMSKATAHRYAMALRHVNLLRYDSSTGEYTLGPQVLVLAAVARASLPIITVAGPIMEDLVRETNETAVLSIWDGEAPVVVRVDDSTERVIRVSMRSGTRLNLFASSQGRVFCAFLPEASVPGLAEELERSPWLRGEIAAIRERHVALNATEHHGVRAIAAPVFSGGQLVAVMALIGTTTTLAETTTSPAALALSRAAERLSDLHGHYTAAPEADSSPQPASSA